MYDTSARAGKKVKTKNEKQARRGEAVCHHQITRKGGGKASWNMSGRKGEKGEDGKAYWKAQGDRKGLLPRGERVLETFKIFPRKMKLEWRSIFSWRSKQEKPLLYLNRHAIEADNVKNNSSARSPGEVSQSDQISWRRCASKLLKTRKKLPRGMKPLGIDNIRSNAINISVRHWFHPASAEAISAELKKASGSKARWGCAIARLRFVMRTDTRSAIACGQDRSSVFECFAPPSLRVLLLFCQYLSTFRSDRFWQALDSRIRQARRLLTGWKSRGKMAKNESRKRRGWKPVHLWKSPFHVFNNFLFLFSFRSRSRSSLDLASW